MKNAYLKDEHNERIKWIDCAKAVAITAVAIDHCKGLLYSSSAVQQASFFSVSLFVVLAGISARVAESKRKPTLLGQLKKIMIYYMQFAIAEFVSLVFYNHFFNMETYISNILSFNAHFYFLVFFFQLMLISPFLLSWCEFCDHRKWKYMWHMVTLFILCCCGSLFVNYTFVLDVHGGGRYLFGGTYIILYYLGILLAHSGLFSMSVRKRIFVLGMSAVFWIWWWRLSVRNVLSFDAWLEPIWGDGFNPPSMQFMVFAIITLFLTYSLFSLLEELTWKLMRKVVGIFAFLGRYTFYTFLYHFLVADIIYIYCPFVLDNTWVKRICIFIPMIVAPPICAWLLQKGKVYYLNLCEGTQ